MTLKVSLQPFLVAVCRLAAGSAVPAWGLLDDFFSITRTQEELSIVCLEKNVPEGVQAERGWVVFKVEGPLDFGLTGILFSLLQPLAEAKISVFAVSTFDTDYILIKKEKKEAAMKALSSVATLI